MTSLQVLGFDWHLISYPQQLEHLWIPSQFIFYVLRLFVFFWFVIDFFNLPFSVKLGWKFPLAASSSPLNCVRVAARFVWTCLNSSQALLKTHTHTFSLSRSYIYNMNTLLIGMPCIYVNTEACFHGHTIRGQGNVSAVMSKQGYLMSESVHCVHPRSSPAVCLTGMRWFKEARRKQRTASSQDMTRCFLIFLLEYGWGMLIGLGGWNLVYFKLGGNNWYGSPVIYFHW